MRIAFANDHAAHEARTAVLAQLRDLGHEVVDYGFAGSESVDYPDYAGQAAAAVACGEVDLGIVMCGSGIGVSIVANKFSGVRCALCTDLYGAEMSRRHNDANCLALRVREQTAEMNAAIIALWLKTEFEGGRHCGRVDKIDSVAQVATQKRA